MAGSKAGSTACTVYVGRIGSFGHLRVTMTTLAAGFQPTLAAHTQPTGTSVVHKSLLQ
jgi:hypothetical protein